MTLFKITEYARDPESHAVSERLVYEINIVKPDGTVRGYHFEHADSVQEFVKDCQLRFESNPAFEPDDVFARVELTDEQALELAARQEAVGYREPDTSVLPADYPLS
jgi:hypothetical protein